MHTFYFIIVFLFSSICQRLAAGSVVFSFVSDLRQDQWFSPGTPIFSTNKTDRHDIAEILLKVALNTITLTLNLFSSSYGNFVCTFVSTLTLFSNKCLEDNIFRNDGIVRPY